MPPTDGRFWETKALGEMSAAEWEALCDGCARCCLIKLEDVETGRIHYTDVACRLLDANLCRCTDYTNRQARVPGCLRLTPQSLPEMAAWLPPTCAYRLLHEGKPLYDWHPLVSGDAESVHASGISVRGRTVAEKDVAEAELENRTVRWPQRRKTRAPGRGNLRGRKKGG
jgi:uncharacterized cysteine cluster protein YcgN (CxxCxxCC family)